MSWTVVTPLVLWVRHCSNWICNYFRLQSLSTLFNETFCHKSMAYDYKNSLRQRTATCKCANGESYRSGNAWIRATLVRITDGASDTLTTICSRFFSVITCERHDITLWQFMISSLLAPKRHDITSFDVLSRAVQTMSPNAIKKLETGHKYI
jgi:hypothetical protein